MQIEVFPIALAAAGLMGFANQRGGACMVAAIEEIVAMRRFGRALAILETSLWVAAGFILLDAAHVLRAVPPDYAVGIATIVGGALFGIGAFTNGACLFGTVARLGSGEWAFGATLVGLFLGGFAGARVHFPQETHAQSLVLGASVLVAMAALGFIALRLYVHGSQARRAQRRILGYLWSPHVATMIIGLAFLVVFEIAGAWDYGEFLRGLGQGDVAGWLSKLLLGLALLAGAIAGGGTSRLLKFAAPAPASLVKCLAGGCLMGVGASLIPGGNTSLSLLSMPLLWPYAWLAFATISITIFLATWLTWPHGSDRAASVGDT